MVRVVAVMFLMTSLGFSAFSGLAVAEIAGQLRPDCVQNGRDPVCVANMFFSLLHEHDLQSAYSLLTAASQTSLTFQSFISSTDRANRWPGRSVPTTRQLIHLGKTKMDEALVCFVEKPTNGYGEVTYLAATVAVVEDKIVEYQVASTMNPLCLVP